MTWPEVKFWPWPFKVKLYIARRALTRQTRWYQNCCSTFKIKKIVVQKRFGKILEFWPLVTSILTWAKKWPNWFRDDFSRAFERRFPFCSTMRRSRDRRGGGVFKHSPPAGGGKFRGPSGRGLISSVVKSCSPIQLPASDLSFRDQHSDPSDLMLIDDDDDADLMLTWGGAKIREPH